MNNEHSYVEEDAERAMWYLDAEGFEAFFAFDPVRETVTRITGRVAKKWGVDKEELEAAVKLKLIEDVKDKKVNYHRDDKSGFWAFLSVTVYQMGRRRAEKWKNWMNPKLTNSSRAGENQQGAGECEQGAQSKKAVQRWTKVGLEVASPVDPGLLPEEVIDLKILEEFFNGLPYYDNVVLVKYFIDGYGYADIAKYFQTVEDPEKKLHEGKYDSAWARRVVHKYREEYCQLLGIDASEMDK